MQKKIHSKKKTFKEQLQKQREDEFSKNIHNDCEEHLGMYLKKRTATFFQTNTNKNNEENFCWSFVQNEMEFHSKKIAYVLDIS